MDIKPKYIEGCHRLPISGKIRASNKRVIIKCFVWKHSEVLLQSKKTISSKGFSHLNVHGKIFVSGSLCLHYQYVWGKCKDQQRSGIFTKSFALAVLLQLKLPNVAMQENISWIWHFWYWYCWYMRKIRLKFFFVNKIQTHFFLESIFVSEYFAPFTPFLFTIFPSFYQSTSVSRILLIKTNMTNKNVWTT